MKKIVFTVLLILFLMGGLLGQNDPPPIPHGTGTINNPYRIQTEEHLRWMSTTVEWANEHNLVYFIQEDDIIMSDENFTPIGFQTTIHNHTGRHFIGVYDGQGFKITNLRITSTAPSSTLAHAGLFNIISNSTIKNLTLENSQIRANTNDGWSWVTSQAGGIAGVSYNSIIRNCSVVEGSVFAHARSGVAIGVARADAGGLVGYADNTLIEYSWTTANVTAESTSDFPGIVTVQTSSSMAGGIVGWLHNSSGYDKGVNNSYSRGIIRASTNTNGLGVRQSRSGGIVGNLYHNSRIQRSYSTGLIQAVGGGGAGGGNWRGGIVGSRDGNHSNILFNVFNNVTTGTTQLIGNVTSNPANNKGVGNSDINNQATFTVTPYSWDFVNIWGINPNNPPYLRLASPPSNLVSQVTDSGISLSWNEPSLIIKPIEYYIIHRQTGSGHWDPIGQTNNEQTISRSWIDSNMVINTNYNYRVTAVYLFSGNWSNHTNTESGSIWLSNPQMLTANLVTGAVQLNWQPPNIFPSGDGLPPLSYNIYKRIGNGNKNQIAENLNVTNFSDTDIALLEFHDFTYSIVAIFGSFESDPIELIFWSPIIRNPPRNLVSTVCDETWTITLTWDAPLGGNTGTFSHYRVFRNDVEILSPNLIATTWTDLNPLPFAPNRYYVRAVYINPAGESQSSNTVIEELGIELETKDPLAPLFVSAKRTMIGVEISWEKPLLGNPDGYEIFRSMNGEAETPIGPLPIARNVRRWVDSTPFGENETFRVYGVRAIYSRTIGGERTTGSSQSVTLNEERTVSTSLGVSFGLELGYSGEFGHYVATVGTSIEVSCSYAVGTAIGNEINKSESFSWSTTELPSDIARVVIINNTFNEPRNLTFLPPIGQHANEVFLEWQIPANNPNSQYLIGYYVYRDGLRIVGSGTHIPMITPPMPYPQSSNFPDNIHSSLLVIGLDYTYHVTAVYNTPNGIIESRPSNLIRAYTTGGSQPLGAGTQLNPYLIETLAHLKWVSEFAQVRNNTNGWASNLVTPIFFRQIAHIDASDTHLWHGYMTDDGWLYRGFRPIGISHQQSHSDIRFRGVFDGQGFEIQNLLINATEYALFPVGLFSVVEGIESEIRNVHLVNATINGGSIVGGLVGELVNGARIVNSSVNGTVFGFESVGGLVGFAGTSSTIDRSFSEGTIIGSIAGGLAGTIRSGTIIDSYSTSEILGGYIGGLAGFIANTSIFSSYFNGDVENTIDGLSGKIVGAAFLLVQNNTVTPPITANSISNTYWVQNPIINGFGEITNQHLASSSMSRTEEQMKLQSTFTGWDFINTWGICQGFNDGFPHLRTQHLVCIFNATGTVSHTVNTHGHVVLDWTAPEAGSCGQLTGFRVYRSIGTGSFTHIGTLSANELIFTDQNPQNGALNTYMVRAVYTGNNVSGDSNEVSVNVTLPAVLNTPVISNCRVTLSWSIPTTQAMRGLHNFDAELSDQSESCISANNRSSSSDDLENENGTVYIRAATGFRVYRNGVQIATNHATTTFVDNNATCGNTYNYHVIAVYSNGESPASNTQQVVMPTNHIFNPPLGLTRQINNGIINLNWSAPQTGSCGTLASYKIFRNGSELMTTTNTTFADTDPILNSNNVYFVRAVYINPAGESGNSNIVEQWVGPEFTISPVSHNFGSIIIGQTSATFVFEITNTGNTNLNITSIQKVYSDPQNEFILSPAGGTGVIVPNGTRTFSVAFKPESTGNKTNSISIVHNAIGSPGLVPVSGVGQRDAEIGINPPSHSFGNIVVDQQSELQTFTISNNGGSDLIISSITLPASTHSNQFNLSVTGLPWTITPSGTPRTFTVRFNPTSTGFKDAEIRVVDNLPNFPLGSNEGMSYTLTRYRENDSRVESFTFGNTTSETNEDENIRATRIVPISGTGVAPEFEINPFSQDFGLVLVGSTSTSQTFSITNPGTANLIISSLSIPTSEHSNQFTISGNTGLPWTITPHGTAGTFTVSFAPTTTGSKNAYVRIIHNADGTPTNVPILGTGDPLPEPNITPGTIDFGTITIGQSSSPQTVTITNVGGGSLIINTISLPSGENQYELNNGNILPVTLTANQSISFSATFKPTSAGVKTSNISIAHNTAGSPFIIPMTGTGRTPSEFEINPEGTIQLGDVYIGQTSNLRAFTITNKGDVPLTFQPIQPTGDVNQFVMVDLNDNPITLNKDEIYIFRVVFAPTTVGFKELVLTINHTATGSPEIVRINGNGLVPLPTFTIYPSPPPHDFGNVYLGETSNPISFTITNTGMSGSVLTIEPIAIFGNDSRYFRLIGGNTAAISLDKDETYNFSAEFMPTTAGLKDVNILIIHNATGTPASPVYVRMIGTGFVVPPPIFKITPESHDFGLVDTDKTVEKVFVLENLGESDLLINSISFSGVDENDFTHSATGLPWTITPSGNPRTFTVFFTPKTEGNKSADMIIFHNSDGMFDNVRLTGEGADTSDEAEVIEIPRITALHSNFPNPFNPETTIRFALQNNEYVLIEIFNIRGQMIRTLVDYHRSAGEHQVVWNGRDNSGNQVTSGIYFYRMRAGEYQFIRRMVLMK